MRIGWATYRPNQIEAGRVYTFTFWSPSGNTIPIDWVGIAQTYGLRIPPDCIGSCGWVPMHWCYLNEVPFGIRVLHNIHPDGIWPLGGQPQGPCTGILGRSYLPLTRSR